LVCFGKEREAKWEVVGKGIKQRDVEGAKKRGHARIDHITPIDARKKKH